MSAVQPSLFGEHVGGARVVTIIAKHRAVCDACGWASSRTWEESDARTWAAAHVCETLA